MKQLGNLAIVCAQRRDTLLQILDGMATVHVGHGPERIAITADWHDDAKIMGLVYELNHGSLSDKNINSGGNAA